MEKIKFINCDLPSHFSRRERYSNARGPAAVNCTTQTQASKNTSGANISGKMVSQLTSLQGSRWSITTLPVKTNPIHQQDVTVSGILWGAYPMKMKEIGLGGGALP